jgi:hypothetical protein
MVSVPGMWTPLERRSTDIVAALAFRSRFEHFGGLTRLDHSAREQLNLENDHSVCVRKPRLFVGVSSLTYQSPITIVSST